MALVCLLTALFLASTVNAYNILIIYPSPSFSHQVPAMALTEALVRKGHQVFVVSPNVVPGLEKNYTYVDISFSKKFFSDEKKDGTVFLQRQMTRWDTTFLFKPASDIAGKQYNSTQFLQFFNRVKSENIKFDVAVLETFYVPSACAMTRLLTGTGRYTPMISMSSIAFDFFAEQDIGSTTHGSFLPSLWDHYTDKMNIWEKIDNWYSHWFMRRSLRGTMEESAKEYFRGAYGPEYESLVDGCWSNISLAMISSNFLYYYPRLKSPNVIEVGPMHLDKAPQKLPQNLQNWFDGAEKGVIYFSLGSNMKSKSLDPTVISHFLKYFRELPTGYRVLWKWELDEKIPGQSDNVLAQKWTPQHSILAHPKVKAFITQGGLQSFQETVHYGVPTVGIPWFGDQELNVAKMVDAGFGTRIRPPELFSYEKIKSALDAVLFDESYMRNMKRQSAISRDFTPKSVDTAVFWVEHVAKFGGAPHLRPSTADASYIEFLCLDIMAVILLLSLTILYVIRLIFRFLINSIFSSSESKLKKS